MSKRVSLEKVRRAVADYMYSEGCHCCRADNHDEHGEVLALLLDVPAYEDGSGFNFAPFRTQEPTDA